MDKESSLIVVNKKHEMISAAPLQGLLLSQNNFDLLRFIFAFIVLLFHAHVLSGVYGLTVLSEVLSSEIAVKSFFVVGGF